MLVPVMHVVITSTRTCKPWRTAHSLAADLPRWRKCQALLKFKREERRTLREDGDEEEFSDEV